MQKNMESERDNGYSHVLKYTGIFGGVQGLNILISLVRNKVVASILGPGGMGLVALFNSVITFISQATNLGVSFSAVRHVSELYDEGGGERLEHFVKIVRGWSLLTALMGMLVCVVAGPLLSSYTFSWGDHTLHFVLLAPAVALLALTGGEAAILKGCRQLKALAAIQVLNVLAALIVAVPIYYFFGESGIVPVIVLTALAAMVITIRYSLRLFPLRLKGANGILGEGMEMVRLGVAFVLAGILGSGAEMFIRSYLNIHGNLDTVGLYNAAFLLTITYGSMVFSAMETDYFPRLSATTADRVKMSETVNRQIEVSLLLISPMLAVFIVLLPVLVPLLFSSDFTAMVPMAQVMVLAMYLRAVTLPISYTVLAHGDSLFYLIIEGTDSLLLVALVLVGYTHWGLLGIGLALVASYVVDLVIISLFTRWRYGYTMSRPMLSIAAQQLPLGLAVYMVTLTENPVLYWTVGAGLCGISCCLSYRILRQKSRLWNALTNKVKHYFKKHGKG